MPVRCKITGPSDQLALVNKNLAKLPSQIPDILKEAVPTMTVLLSHSTTSSPVDREKNPYVKRRYNVPDEMQQRIDDNTIVAVEGNSIRVGTSGDDPHLRPVVPITGLPLKWRGALSQKINGSIRQRLAYSKSVQFINDALAGGPVSASAFKAQAKAAGVRGKQFTQAKKDLGVRREGRKDKAVFTRAPKLPKGPKLPKP